MIEVWTSKGLERFIVLFFIDLSTRRVEIGGRWFGLVAHTRLLPVRVTGVVPAGTRRPRALGVGGLTGTAAAGPLTAKSR